MFVKIEGIFNKKALLYSSVIHQKEAILLCLVQAGKYE